MSVESSVVSLGFLDAGSDCTPLLSSTDATEFLAEPGVNDFRCASSS